MPVFVSKKQYETADFWLLFRLWYADALSLAVIVGGLTVHRFPIWLTAFGVVWYLACLVEYLAHRGTADE